jgi:DNA helicase HerA-like ATPase
MTYKTLPVMVYIGPPGCGKSYAAKRMIDRYRDHGRFVVAHDITGEWSNHADAIFSTDEFLRIGWKELPRGAFIVVDEAPLVVPHAAKAGNLVFDVLTKGRHRGYGIVCITQRAADVNRVVTAHATRVQAFRTYEPRDLTYLKARGFDEEKVKNLGQYQSITWTPKRGAK